MIASGASAAGRCCGGRGAGALGLSLAGFLAACGDDGGGGGGEGRSRRARSPKNMTFSNWPYYIDVKGKRHPTLDQFQKKYGTKVKYVEEINDNVEFFGKVRQQYAQGNSGGRDLHVVTDWMCDRMKQLGYVQKLDKSAMPNVVKNIEPAVAQPGLRPQARVLGAVADGPGAADLPQGQDRRRPHEHQRPVRPEVQGQGHDAHRDARHGRLGAARRGHRARRTRPRTRRCRRSTRSRRPPRTARSGASPATSTSRDIAQGRLRRDPRLVRRRGRSCTADNKNVELQAARGGLHGLHGLHADPGRRAARVHGREVHGLRLRPGDRRRRSRRTSTTCRRSRASRRAREERPGARREPADLPGPRARRTTSRRSRPRTRRRSTPPSSARSAPSRNDRGGARQ